MTRRIPLPAAIPPEVAHWLLRRVPPEEWEDAARRYESEGNVGRARQLRQARAQVVQAALDAIASERGNAEGPKAEAVAASSSVRELTTAQAAERLGLSDRRVRQLCADDRLSSRRHGRALLVDAASVEDLRDVRRSA